MVTNTRNLPFSPQPCPQHAHCTTHFRAPPARAVRRIPYAPTTHNTPSWLFSFIDVVVLVATYVPVVVGTVMWSPWGWLWWWGGLTFCVSASSNRQEQQQEHRHTGHCNSPFPCPLRPCDRQALPPDHPCPPTGTNSMPRRRRTQTSAVRSLTQPRGRLAANQAAPGTSQHHSTPSKHLYTHRPTHRLTS